MKDLKPPFRDMVYANDHEWLNHYDRKFKARRAVMLHAINRGWTIQECRLVFLNEKYPGAVIWLLGDDDRCLSSHEVNKRFADDWDRCYARYKANSRFTARDVRQSLSMLRAQAESARWQGRTGKTDRDVFLYVLTRMIDIGCDRINVSRRDASLGAGVGPETASRALTRLCDAGYLVKTNNFRSFHHANEFRVCHNEPYNLFYGENHMAHDDTPNVTHVDASHECWVRLGKTAADIYHILSDNPLSARAIAKLAAVGNKTASRNLPKLKNHGLAEQTDTGWIIGKLTPDDLTDLVWDSDSRVEKRKAQFDRDRRIRSQVQETVYQQQLRDANDIDPWMSSSTDDDLTELAKRVPDTRDTAWMQLFS